MTVGKDIPETRKVTRARTRPSFIHRSGQPLIWPCQRLEGRIPNNFLDLRASFRAYVLVPSLLLSWPWNDHPIELGSHEVG